MKSPDQREMYARGTAVSDFIRLVNEELVRAEKKFPTWPVDVIHGVAVMAEEAGEAVKASLDYAYFHDASINNLETELIQTAAMAIRAWVGLDSKRAVMVKEKTDEKS